MFLHAPSNCIEMLGYVPGYDQGIVQQQIVNLGLNISLVFLGEVSASAQILPLRMLSFV